MKSVKDRAKVQRGVIVGPSMDVDFTQMMVHQHGWHGDQIRFWLLFFDEIVGLTEPNFGWKYPADYRLLVDEGVFSLRDCRHPGGEGSRIIQDNFTRAMAEFEHMYPGRWAVGTGASSINVLGGSLIRDDELEQGRAALVSLFKVLPVPTGDVPLADVLEFKARRQPELEALRRHVDQLYLTIASSSDPAFAINSCSEGLRVAANDYIKAIREAGSPLKMFTWSAEINLLPAALAAGVSFFVQQPLATILSNMSIAAGAGLAVNMGLAWRRRDTTSPFRYVAKMHDELLGP